MRRPIYREEDLPPPGTVFLAPTRDGRLAAGRVLRRAFEGGAQAALVAATPWIGEKPPALDLPQLRETLLLNHHKWQNQPEVFWATEPLPKDYQVLGQIELSTTDQESSSNVFTGWQSVPLQVLLQWRWDHDREALLRDEAEATANLAETRRQRAAARAEFMSTLTLEKLASRVWFPKWEILETQLPLEQTRAVFSSLVADLNSKTKLTQSVVKARVKQAILELNRLDEQYDHFIATIEREEIDEAIMQVLCAAKFPLLDDQIDRWRKW